MENKHKRTPVMVSTHKMNSATVLDSMSLRKCRTTTLCNYTAQRGPLIKAMNSVNLLESVNLATECKLLTDLTRIQGANLLGCPRTSCIILVRVFPLVPKEGSQWSGDALRTRPRRVSLSRSGHWVSFLS